MLAADVGIAYYPFTVDDEETRPLAQGEDLTLHLVAVVDSVLRVNQTREWDIMPLEVCPRLLYRIVDDGHNLDAAIGELGVIPRQLTEVPAAEGSPEATQEN